MPGPRHYPEDLMETMKYSIMLYNDGQHGDIIFVEFREHLKVDLELAMEIVMKRLRFVQNQKHYLLIDLSNVKGVTSDAKEYLQRPDAGLKDILAAAFVGANPLAHLISKIFIKTPKDFPAKFFQNRVSAFRWVQEYRKNFLEDGRNTTKILVR